MAIYAVQSVIGRRTDQNINFVSTLYNDNKMVSSSVQQRESTGISTDAASTLPKHRQFWNSDEDITVSDKLHKRFQSLRPFYQNICYVSVIIAFTLGLLVGIFIPVIYLTNLNSFSQSSNSILINSSRILNISEESHYNPQLLKSIFVNNSFSKPRVRQLEAREHNNSGSQMVKSVRFIETGDEEEQFVDSLNDVLFDGEKVSQVEDLHKNSPNVENSEAIRNGIYWGAEVERSLPNGYGKTTNEKWIKFIQNGIAVRLENGCGRMQNRLVTFKDGSQACVRYRQNTDQIQGELFSFYLAQILHLPNLAPSAISVIDLNEPLWQNLRGEISAAQWSSNRPVVLTKYITNLDLAHIPALFKPTDRHLNRYDVANITAGYNRDNFNYNNKNHNLTGTNVLNELIELAQWSDLIIFDYLTANLDRIVNNLYNYQWNSNIMDAPAHNLAKKIDSKLLLFLDNESGLLHGYRLLKKYEVYHTLLLDNLCVFRKSTADVIRQLRQNKNVGQLLRDMFEQQNSDKVKEILPTLPDKSIKVLNTRIERVFSQITKCESIYG